MVVMSCRGFLLVQIPKRPCRHCANVGPMNFVCVCVCVFAYFENKISACVFFSISRT